MQLPDIYFHSEYGKLYETHEQGEYDFFEFKNSVGIIHYNFLKRAIPLCVESKTYYDIITPYGYGGPVILQCEAGQQAALVASFDLAFTDFCKKNNIVCEYVRFHPLIANHTDFFSIYKTQSQRKTVAIDLSGDFFNNEFTSRCRNSIRKAQNEGVIVELDFHGNRLNEFYRIYFETMKKLSASEYYYFGRDYFEQLLATLTGHYFFTHAFYQGEIIASSIILIGPQFLHYHLSGTLPNYLGLCANQAMLYAAAQWGAISGKSLFHLGGGTSSDENDKLLFFKKSFTRSELYPYFTGEKVRNMPVYDRLNAETKSLSGWTPSFFPIYRSALKSVIKRPI